MTNSKKVFFFIAICTLLTILLLTSCQEKNNITGNVIIEPAPPTELDTDQIPDTLDNCPSINNPDQHNYDDDAYGDLCDESPCGPNAQVIQNQCQCLNTFVNERNDWKEGCQKQPDQYFGPQAKILEDCDYISSGKYILNQDIEVTHNNVKPPRGVRQPKVTQKACFIADNSARANLEPIVLDCQGHRIYWDTKNVRYSARSQAIFLQTKLPVTVQNCVIEDFAKGIVSDFSQQVTIEKNTLLNNPEGIKIISTPSYTLNQNNLDVTHELNEALNIVGLRIEASFGSVTANNISHYPVIGVSLSQNSVQAVFNDNKLCNNNIDFSCSSTPSLSGSSNRIGNIIITPNQPEVCPWLNSKIHLNCE